MECNRCGVTISEEDSYQLHGQVLCEDCYIYLLAPPKACDPAAVASALSAKNQMGFSGTDWLTDLQKKIYALIEAKGKLKRDDLLREINVSPEELERQLAVMRHCEMIRGYKDGNQVYLTKW